MTLTMDPYVYPPQIIPWSHASSYNRLHGYIPPPYTPYYTPYWYHRFPWYSLRPEIHPFFGVPSAAWNVHESPDRVQFIDHHSRRLSPVHAGMLAEPATQPPVRRMHIINEEFRLSVKIQVPPGQVVTLRIVLAEIYHALQKPLRPEEWEVETDAWRAKVYSVMCDRIRHWPPSIRPDVHVLKIDRLLDKTVFKGLSLAGDKWRLSLGSTRNHMAEIMD